MKFKNPAYINLVSVACFLFQKLSQLKLIFRPKKSESAIEKWGEYREIEKYDLKYFTSNEDTEDDLSQGSSKTGYTNPIHEESSSWNEIDYANWNDPNELIDRLRILMAEQTAGNQIHLKEIVKIIEELRGAGYRY